MWKEEQIRNIAKLLLVVVLLNLVKVETIAPVVNQLSGKK